MKSFGSKRAGARLPRKDRDEPSGPVRRGGPTGRPATIRDVAEAARFRLRLWDTAAGVILPLLPAPVRSASPAAANDWVASAVSLRLSTLQAVRNMVTLPSATPSRRSSSWGPRSSP